MSETSNALCFGEPFPATGTPCHVEIVTAGLKVRYAGQSLADQEEAVSFSALAVSAGGVNQDQLVVKWGLESRARTLYLKDPSLIVVFRRAVPPELMKELEATAAKVRQVRSRRRAVWAVVAGAVGALTLFLWFGSDVLLDLAVDRIPIEWEQKLGESAYRDFLAQQNVITEGPAVDAVKEITQRLTAGIPESPYNFEVSVVKSDVVNAFALPGGYVVVFTGLMAKAESGEEVAGVLSHEWHHVLQRHGLERIVKQIGLIAVLTVVLGDHQGLSGLMKQLGIELLTLKFGREQEIEADVKGLQLLHRARIDPADMIRFFERLSEQEKGRVEILSTHPMSDDRAERLKAEVASLPKSQSEPFIFNWTAVQRSLAAQAPIQE